MADGGAAQQDKPARLPVRAAEPLPERVAVIGAGTMGARIALFFARAGLAVSLASRRQPTLDAAAAAIRSEAAGQPEILARITFTTDLAAGLDTADLVVETIREDLTDKLALLREAGSLLGPAALLTTNTSSLDLTALAGAVAHPERFAGLHWFNPANLVELVEVVPAPVTAAATVHTLRAWLAALGKVPIVIRRAVPGFVANRLQYALLREAYALVASGVCSWADADLAVTAGLGPRWAAIGPFQSMDIAGLDVHLAVARALFPDLAAGASPPDLLARLVDAGQLGAKSGQGLLGDYPAERVDALARLRDAMLRAVPLVREPPAAADTTGEGPPP